MSFCGPFFLPFIPSLSEGILLQPRPGAYCRLYDYFCDSCCPGAACEWGAMSLVCQLLQQPVLWLQWWSANWEGSPGKRVINQLLPEIVWAQTHCPLREAHEILVYPVFSFGWSLLSPPMHVKYWPQSKEEIRDLLDISLLPHNPAKAMAWEGIHSSQFSI